MLLQADVYFKLDGAGWTERYHLDPPDQPLADVAHRLADARYRLLEGPATMIGVRLDALDDSARVCRLKLYRVGVTTVSETGLFYITTREESAHAPWTVAQMKWVTVTGAERMVNLGGMRDVSAGPRRAGLFQAFAHDQVAMLDTFRDALGAPSLSLQIRHIKAPAGAAAEVASIGTDAGGLYRITTRQDYPAKSGEYVRIMGGTGGTNLGRARGLRTVRRAEGPRAFTLDRGPLPEGGPLRYLGGATARAVEYAYDAAIWLPLAMGAASESGVEFPFVPWNYVLYRSHPEAYGLSSRQRGFGVSKRVRRARA